MHRLYWAGILLLLTMCQPNFTAVTEQLNIAGQPVVLLRKSADAKDPSIAMVGSERAWSRLATEMAMRNYSVYIVNTADERILRPVLDSLWRRAAGQKLGLLAADSSAMLALRYAAAGNNVPAVAILDLPPDVAADSLRKVSARLQNRSIVYIAAAPGFSTPDSLTQLYFSCLPEIKKLVLLDNGRHGVQLLQSDAAPIICRTCFLLFEHDLAKRR